MLRKLVFLSLVLATPAFAQTTSALRATVDTISADGMTLMAHSRAGEAETVHVKPETRLIVVVPAKLEDVKPGAYIGVAAAPNAQGAMEALEVHIFPEAMRGAGEGHRPFDLAPNSTMTNGALKARVDSVSGPVLTVTYSGGEQNIAVTPKTAIVAFEPGVRADIKPGAAIVARGGKGADGTFAAGALLIGRDGFVPPL